MSTNDSDKTAGDDISNAEPIDEKIIIIEDELLEEESVSNILEDTNKVNDDLADMLEEEEKDKTPLSAEEMKTLNKIITVGDKLEDVITVLNGEHEKLGQVNFMKELNKIDSYVDLIKRKIGSYTDQTEFFRDALKKADVSKFSDRYIEDSKGIRLVNSVLSIKDSEEKDVSGKKAKLMIMASNKNIKKVILYGSGFYIVLRSPVMGELNNLYNALNDASVGYGSQFGAIFYLFADLVITDILWRFVEELIIDSNLERWDKGRRVSQCISLNDKNHVLLSIASLMFKSGYDFVHVCNNPLCKEKTEEKIDLALMQQTDFSKLTETHIEILTKTGKITDADLERYRAAFVNGEDSTVGTLRFKRRVPTILDFINHGKKFNSDLINYVSDLDDENLTSAYIRCNYNRLFAPWLSTVETIKEDGSVGFRTTSEEAILVALNELQDDNEESINLKNQLEDFMSGSIVTHTGYKVGACTKCGHEPTNTKDGFVPFDVQGCFFTVLVMKLIQAC